MQRDHFANIVNICIFYLYTKTYNVLSSFKRRWKKVYFRTSCQKKKKIITKSTISIRFLIGFLIIATEAIYNFLDKIVKYIPLKEKSFVPKSNETKSMHIRSCYDQTIYLRKFSQNHLHHNNYQKRNNLWNQKSFRIALRLDWKNKCNLYPKNDR